VIQYVYEKYGRERAALAATVIRYRPKSAVRDVGKAMGLDPLFVDQLAKSLSWWDRRGDLARRFEEARLASASRMAEHFMRLVNDILGFPRHLSQHVGGFIISRGPLSALVPMENAAMPERTLIQWDKNDIESLGLLKVDILGLGMLTAIRRALALVSARRGTPFGIEDIPPEDPEVYDMICRADTVGVFQIESRAQMAMLPRLRPRSYYDLVIEVAIVRPGPIQGDMVHPYLKRRQGLEPVTYPSRAVREVLGRTLGVPIFQEQLLRIAMAAAGFTGGEAEELRRAMGFKRSADRMKVIEKKLRTGMAERGITDAAQEEIVRSITSFALYGFPESHAASFALIAYASAYLKAYHPTAFYISLLNAWPMGFYHPATLIKDAQRHGVEVLPIDAQHSDWRCTWEDRPNDLSSPWQKPITGLGQPQSSSTERRPTPSKRMIPRSRSRF